jgi:hypothetical protein
MLAKESERNGRGEVWESWRPGRREDGWKGERRDGEERGGGEIERSWRDGEEMVRR